MNNELFVTLMSFLAGFIDAIAGGGGLITVPMWTMVLGPGAHVIATNKVGAFASCLMALIIYTRKHPLPWREGLPFLIAITVGAFIGSQLTALVSQQIFAWMLLALCPMVLWMVWSKEKLFAERPPRPARPSQFMIAGFLVGVYDGFFGPGGGTFMLLALLGFTHMPLMSALALSKLSNSLTAGVSLAGFAMQGLVDWRWGAIGASTIMVGSFLGARMASTKAKQVVRPAMTVVVVLLMAKIVWDLLRN